MTVINTNIAAHITSNAMKSNARNMETAMERLSTGTRVNSASDDAAGLAIGSKMTSQINGLTQASRNANDAISLLQTADGAAIEIGDMLQRMRELAVQAANGTNDTNDIANLNKEFAALATEIDRVADDTEFNGLAVLKGDLQNDRLDFVVGKDAADTVRVNFADFNLTEGVASSTELLGTASEALSEGASSNIAVDLGGTIYLSDGTTQISVDIDDVRNTATSASLNVTDVTHTQLAAALQVKAAANTDFKVTVGASGTGLTFAEKAGEGGGVVKMLYTGSTATNGSSVKTATFSGGQAGTTGGVMAADLSAYKSTASGSLKNVDTGGTIGEIDAAILGVAQARADFGASINSLEHTLDNLSVGIQNTSAARSAIIDADYAAETTELARTQILSQAATAMLSQANQQAQSVLALLK
jgi:flagellin